MLSYLTSLGFSHPWMPTLLYLSLGSLCTFLSLHFHPRSLGASLFYLILGIFCWTLIEYLLHRFLFHFRTMKEPWKGLISQAHLEHHRTARSGEGILVRPFFTLITAVFVYFGFVLLTSSFTLALLFSAGVFLGYIAYEWIHFAAHRFHPSSSLLHSLKQYHLHHHFKDSDSAFGVTSPLWDWIFGTRP